MRDESYPGEADEVAAAEAACTPPPRQEGMTRWSKEDELLSGDPEAMPKMIQQQRETITRLEGELKKWRDSFAGHVYVENEEWSAKCEEVRTLQARLTASEAAKTWTNQPTSEGWYFWKRIVRQKEVKTVVRVKKNWGNAKLYIQACRYVEECKGSWQGPLTPGEE